MGIEQLLETTREAVTVKRVFGEPYEHDGITIVPAAKLGGGAGGGESEGEAGKTPAGAGMGMGMGAAPAGAFVLEGNHVTWKPAVDVNRVILGGQIVAIVALLTLRSIVRARARARARMACA